MMFQSSSDIKRLADGELKGLLLEKQKPVMVEIALSK